MECVPANAEDPNRLRPKRAPSSSAQSTRRMVMGGLPWKSSANPRSTSKPASTPRQPSSQPPLGTESRWLPRISVRSDSPRKVVQEFPAASKWCSTGSAASLPWNHARALSHVGVQAIRCAPRSSAVNARSSSRLEIVLRASTGMGQSSVSTLIAVTLGMHLPVNPPVLPMLAKRVDELPAGKTWIFEPKWDGFRALVFRDGDEILIQSRDTKSLNRYFPEVVEALKAQLPERCVLDGEIVIATESGLDFETLQLRIHPAASRVKLLSQQTPASIVFFDLLCVGDQDLRGEPFRTRRKELEGMLRSAVPPIHITPATGQVA